MSCYFKIKSYVFYPGLLFCLLWVTTDAPAQNLSSSCRLQGVRFDPNEPLKLQFIIDTGDGKSAGETDATRLINYFMAGLTLPENDLWVNLSPYEKDRIVEESVGQTDLGKDMLQEDYLLKQLAASLTHPDTPQGKLYWGALRGSQISNLKSDQLFNKVWIMPAQAGIYENENCAIITQSSLKVMIDQDYLAQSVIASEAKQSRSAIATPRNSSARNDVTDAFKTHILPLIEKEVNNGASFTQLRQIYNSLILAVWFKQKFKESFYQAYIDAKKITGIDLSDKHAKDKIYADYLQAFKKGAYDYVKTNLVGAIPRNRPNGAQGENMVSPLRKIIKRHYFSGGVAMNNLSRFVQKAVALPDSLRDRNVVVVDVLMHIEADDRLAKIFQDHRGTNVVSLDKIDPMIRRSVQDMLHGLGSLGVELAARVADLSPENLNLVAGAYYSHAGGQGINIAYRDGMQIEDIIFEVIHEAIAASVFGPPAAVHGLAEQVVAALRRGDHQAARDLLDGLGKQKMRLGQNPLWQMTPQEREAINNERDYAAAKPYEVSISYSEELDPNKRTTSGIISGYGVESKTKLDLSVELLNYLHARTSMPDIALDASLADTVSYIIRYLDARGLIRWSYLVPEHMAPHYQVFARINTAAIEKSDDHTDRVMYRLLKTVWDPDRADGPAAITLTGHDGERWYVGTYSDASYYGTAGTVECGQAQRDYFTLKPVLALPREFAKDLSGQNRNLSHEPGVREYAAAHDGAVTVKYFDYDNLSRGIDEANALKALAAAGVKGVPWVLAHDRQDEFYLKLDHDRDCAASSDLVKALDYYFGRSSVEDKRNNALERLRQAAEILSKVHAAGYVHGNLKADNVQFYRRSEVVDGNLRRDDSVELDDFTLARPDAAGITTGKLKDIADLGRVFVAIADKLGDGSEDLKKLGADMIEASPDIAFGGTAAVLARLGKIAAKSDDDLGGIDFKYRSFNLAVKKSAFSEKNTRNYRGLKLGSVSFKKSSFQELRDSWKIPAK